MEFTTWPDDFRNCGISAKGGRGKKKKFAIFFCGTHFCKGHKPKINIFLRYFFLRQNNTLDRELIISANS